MLSYMPHYIILGEFGIAILLAILAKRVSQGNRTTAIWSGIAGGGVGIFLCYAIAYGLTDGLISR
jgi:uncharacterized membrane protein AbrB (regulator of aidB expression)